MHIKDVKNPHYIKYLNFISNNTTKLNRQYYANAYIKTGTRWLLANFGSLQKAIEIFVVSVTGQQALHRNKVNV